MKMTTEVMDYAEKDGWATAAVGKCFLSPTNYYYWKVVNPNNFDYVTVDEAIKIGAIPGANGKTTKRFEDNDEKHLILFKKNKDALKKFANEAQNSLNLPQMKIEGGIFNLSDHRITGKELNDYSEKINDHEIAQEKAINHLRKEFLTIYNIFESLDKDYLQRIMVNLEAAQEASNQAKEGLEKVEKSNDKIQTAQDDIKQLIEQNKTEIAVLKAHNDKFDELEQNRDLELLIGRVSRIENKMSGLKDAQFVAQESLEKKLENLVNQEKQKVSELQKSLTKTNNMLRITQIFAAITFVLLVVVIVLMITGVL